MDKTYKGDVIVNGILWTVTVQLFESPIYNKSRKHNFWGKWLLECPEKRSKVGGHFTRNNIDELVVSGWLGKDATLALSAFMRSL